MPSGKLFRPNAEGSIRNPTSNAQMNGNILNPPRFAELGGFTTSGKAMRKNTMSVVPPGSGTRREPISGS